MGIKLKDLITEKFEIDLEVGDTILRGKFKNKPVVVKSFGTDEHGQPTINGKKMLSFRIKKLMNKKEVKESTQDCCGEQLNEDSPYNVFKKIEKLKGGALLKFGNEIWVKIGNKKDQWLCKKGPEKGVISDSTVVAQRIFKVLGKKHKLLKIEGEVNEGRPMPMDSPNEFVYLDFKKWVYKNRKMVKKEMLKHGGNASKMFMTLSALWYKWAYKNAKNFTFIKDKSKFGRDLMAMMVKDNLIFDKAKWKKTNNITNIKEKYNIRKQSCTQSDGDKGNTVLYYTDKKGKKRSACHTSKKRAKGQIAAIEAPPR